MSEPSVGVTDHAVERWRQRVGGALDPRPEIAGRVREAWAAGRVSTDAPPGAAAQRGSVYVRDIRRSDLLYVCLHDRPRRELVVVTLWEEGEAAAVPRRFTDALRARRRARGRTDDMDEHEDPQIDGAAEDAGPGEDPEGATPSVEPGGDPLEEAADERDRQEDDR